MIQKEYIGSGANCVDFAKEHFLRTYDRCDDPLYEYHKRHVKEVERWAKIILKDFPDADEEVVLLSVWLHDIGRYKYDQNTDHAINSQTESLRFLPKIGVSPEKTLAVAHCVRSHRNKDIEPQTLEAKILAASDSASHMTDFPYIVLMGEGKKDYVRAKIERGYRDIGLIPGVQEKLTPLYTAWKHLLDAFPE